MTGILFRHIEYVYSMYASPWSFPLTDQVHLDVGCIPLENIVKGEEKVATEYFTLLFINISI